MGASCSSNCASARSEEEVLVAEARRPSTFKLGWKRDLPDFRDRVLALPAERSGSLPASVDLRKGGFLDFPVYNQGGLGSCTANAIGAGFHFDQLREGIQDFAPSRLFVYYNEREMEGTTAYDGGAYIRDGIKSVGKVGVCSEALWPYVEAQFRERPGEECYAAARKSRCLEYARVNQTLDDMQACLSQGFPFVFGFSVYNSFYSSEVAATGRMCMPLPSGDALLGGHAVLCVGYDDERQVFIVRNSWGEGWGDKGYFYMPYAYLSDPSLASDLWVMRNVSGSPRLPTRAMSGNAPKAEELPLAGAGGQGTSAAMAEHREA